MSASTGSHGNRLRRGAAALASRAPWMVDAYRFARNPRWARALHDDLRDTQVQTAFLRDLPPLPPDAPVALLALYRDNVYETKVGLVLATALRLHGVEPVISIPTNRAHRVARYAQAFGIERVIPQDRLRIAPGEQATLDAAAARLLDGPIDFDTIKGWEFHGRNVGSHVLSTLIRTTFDGSPDLALGDNRERMAAILDEVLVNVVRAERLLDDVKPRVVLVEEANYSTNGPMVDVAVDRGIDVVQTIGIWREDALMSKRLTAATRRVDAKSVTPETLARLGAAPWTAEDDAALDRDFATRYGGTWELGKQFQPDTVAYSDAEIAAELDLDPARPTAVIFAHVLWDASLFFGVDLFENYADWLVQAVGAAVANPNVNWVVKAHPSNVFRAAHGDVEGESSEVTLIREHFPELPEHVRLLLPETRISTLSLYGFADYGVTVRGTPGMEIACFGKPAFTAGTGNYAGLGFTYDSTSVDEFLGRLATIETYGRMPDDIRERARRYAHALFLRRPWATRSVALRFDLPETGWHPIDRNVELTARSVADIERAGDLLPWARWAMGSDDPDYVADVAVDAFNTAAH